MTTTHAARRCKAQPARNGQPKSVETKGRPLNQSKIKKSTNRRKKDHPPFDGTKQERFMNKKIRNNKKSILTAALIVAATASAFAQGNGLSGINEATSMVTSYFDPATKLVYAIGAVVGLIGGVKIYGKFSSGDPDTSKTAASWFGACIFLIVAATILRSFFL